MKNTPNSEDSILQIREKLESSMKNLLPMLERVTAAQKMIPKERKVIKFNKNDCLVSLLVDGRIILSPNSLGDSESLYEALSDELLNKTKKKWYRT
jgi:hypothetical protein